MFFAHTVLFRSPVTRSVRRRWFSVVLTGLQPSGKPHLGNYLAAIKPCLELPQTTKRSAPPYLMVTVADLHALTSSGGPNGCALPEAILELSACLVACGIGGTDSLPSGGDGNQLKSILFLQSAVRGHTELAWILGNCCTLPVGFCHTHVKIDEDSYS